MLCLVAGIFFNHVSCINLFPASRSSRFLPFQIDRFRAFMFIRGVPVLSYMKDEKHTKCHTPGTGV